MIPPFTVCISSNRKGIGKTRLAIELLRKLRARGIDVAYAKHCHEDLRLGDGDAERVFRSSCSAVGATGPQTTLLLLRKSVALSDLGLILGKPIVVAEGFKSEKCGFRIWLSSSYSDVAYANEQGIWIDLVVDASGNLSEYRNVEGLAVVTISELDKVVDLVHERALNHALEHLGGEDCGRCGYPTCLEAAKAWLRGASVSCVKKGVRLVVNGKPIALNKFVASLISSVIRALVSNLKGVPTSVRRIELVVDDEG